MQSAGDGGRMRGQLLCLTVLTSFQTAQGRHSVAECRPCSIGPYVQSSCASPRARITISIRSSPVAVSTGVTSTMAMATPGTKEPPLLCGFLRRISPQTSKGSTWIF